MSVAPNVTPPPVTQPAAASAPPATPQQPATAQDVKDRWPAYAWMLNIPDLASILTDPNIDLGNDALVQEKVRETPWFRNTLPAMRAWQTVQATDPAQATQQRQRAEAVIWDQYSQLGLQPNPQEVQDMALQALQFGWVDGSNPNTNSAQLTDAIISHVQYSPTIGQQAGALGANMSQLQQEAQGYFVPLNDETAFGWARQIAAGEQADVKAFLPVLQNQAKSRFSYSPEIQDAITRGVTPEQYFQPYQAEISKQLEVAPDQIDWNSPKWASVLDYHDPQSSTRRPMTIAEAQTYARKQPEWQYTRSANQQASALGEGILTMFGKVADSGTSNLNAAGGANG